MSKFLLAVIDRLSLRALVVLGFFLLAGAFLLAITSNPALLTNAAFMGLAALVIGQGGLGAVAAFYFGSSQGSQAKDARAAAALNPPPAPSANTAARTAQFDAGTMTAGDVTAPQP